MSKSRDQITVNNVTLYIKGLSQRFDNRSNDIGYGSWVGRKTTGKMFIEQCFSLSAEAFKIKPEVACYLVT